MDRKVLFWFAISMVMVVVNYSKSIFYQNISFSLHELSAYPFVILFLCVAFGWMKKDYILSMMKYEKLFAEKAYQLVGSLLILLSIIMPLSDNPVFTLFSIFLIFIGLFFIFFGPAAYIPSLFLFVYGFSVSFPTILDELLGTQYALVTTRLTTGIATLLYPVTHEGQVISVINSEGARSLVYIDAGCSGSASLAIFFTIFALMMIDIKPRQKYILPLFFFGVIGTSLQNILRLVILLATNYHFGTDAMWKMHAYAGYILFPVWFSVFIYVYLMVGVGKKQVAGAESSNNDTPDNG